jgi:spore germination cell wall hydrolase CwlJ-like protein
MQPPENKQPVQLALFENDAEKIATDKLARIIYAETGASSLRAVEALASMVRNLCAQSGRPLSEIVRDETIFESLGQNSDRHQNLFVNDGRLEFQMCRRVAKRAATGSLPDSAMGATRFHRASEMPEWAVCKGYVAEIDDLFFYL